MHHLLWPFINVLILVAVLVMALRKPLSAFVSGRHTALADELQKVRAQLKEAQERYEEFSTRLKALDQEIASIREQTRQEANSAKTKILAEGRELSTVILSDARANADSLFGDLKEQLYHELGARVLERAEVLIRDRLTGDDRLKIRQEFSRQLESVQS